MLPFNILNHKSLAKTEKQDLKSFGWYHEKMIGETTTSPDFIQTITAFRTWHMYKGQLSSFSQTGVWQKQMQAVCKNLSEHCAPVQDCACGLYGFFEFAKVALYSSGVVGVCEYWGRAELHEDGLRAEFSRIKAVCTLPASNSGVGINHHTSSLKTLKRFEEDLSVVLKRELQNLAFIVLSCSIFLSLFNFSLFSILIPLLVYALSIFVKRSRGEESFWERKINQRKLQHWAKANNVVFCENTQQLKAFCTSPIQSKL